jgi:type II secretory pathway component PulJ
MKLSSSTSFARVRTGYLLLECMFYIVVFAIITGLGLATFFLCWDNSKALRYSTDDIASALRAGERWRADIRGATGKITVETTPSGEFLCIPYGTNQIIYHFTTGEIHRQLASSGFAGSMLTAVEASHMVMDRRGPVSAWRWELELEPHLGITRVPLQFSFEAATKTAP